jgi:hypothetical protein
MLQFGADQENPMRDAEQTHQWPSRLVVATIAIASTAALAQNTASLNGIYVGQLVEVTKSRQPPCSQAQPARVVVENGVVSMPSLLLGGGQSAVISAPVASDGSFTGKLVGAEMRGKIAGTALNAKIIVPLRCVYDVTASRH